MHNYFLAQYNWGPLMGRALPVIVILAIWTLIWKGQALWKAARRGENAWFVVLLIVNTLGILEILYLYVFSKDTTPVNGTTQVK